MKIAKGVRVTMKVDVAVVGGETLEKNTVDYIQGGGTMLPFLETLLEGLEKGAKKDGVIKAKDAFGNPALHPLKKMKRTEFPAGVKVAPGETLVAQGVNKLNVIMKIEKVTGDDVDVRLVHPLHDKDIKYAVEIVQVSDPRPPPMPAQALELEPDPES